MTYYRGTSVTAAIIERLGLISQDNGYLTSVGRKVHAAIHGGTPTDVPCIYLLPTKETGSVQYGVSQRERTYEITAIVNRRATHIGEYVADPSAEWVIVDALISDVCMAMEAPGAFSSSLVEHVTYEGAEPAYHEDGGELSGVRLTYSVRFAIAKGDPTNPPS